LTGSFSINTSLPIPANTVISKPTGTIYNSGNGTAYDIRVTVNGYSSNGTIIFQQTFNCCVIIDKSGDGQYATIAPNNLVSITVWGDISAPLPIYSVTETITSYQVEAP
jgi:hypothetical protein